MNYEWDENKAISNWRKHKIRFADAVGVFEDEMALTREDSDAVGESRFITTGTDYLGRVLTVVYTYRHRTLRIISARKATSQERKYYEQYV